MEPVSNVMGSDMKSMSDTLLSMFPEKRFPHVDHWETSRRFLDYLQEFRTRTDFAALLGTRFDAHPEHVHDEDCAHARDHDHNPDNYLPMVTQRNIPFVGICAHHLLPMMGHAAFAYIPEKQFVGLSKIPRLVDAVGHEQPSLQEAYSDRIVDVFMEHVDCLGAAVMIKATHACVACRGPRMVEADTVTTSLRGRFQTYREVREEFYAMLAS